MTCERQVGVDSVFKSSEPLVFEAVQLRPIRERVREVGEGRPPPQLERLAKQASCTRWFARLQGSPSVRPPDPGTGSDRGSPARRQERSLAPASGGRGTGRRRARAPFVGARRIHARRPLRCRERGRPRFRQSDGRVRRARSRAGEAPRGLRAASGRRAPACAHRCAPRVAPEEETPCLALRSQPKISRFQRVISDPEGRSGRHPRRRFDMKAIALGVVALVFAGYAAAAPDGSSTAKPYGVYKVSLIPKDPDVPAGVWTLTLRPGYHQLLNNKYPISNSGKLKVEGDVLTSRARPCAPQRSAGIGGGSSAGRCASSCSARTRAPETTASSCSRRSRGRSEGRRSAQVMSNRWSPTKPCLASSQPETSRFQRVISGLGNNHPDVIREGGSTRQGDRSRRRRTRFCWVRSGRARRFIQREALRRLQGHPQPEGSPTCRRACGP